MIYGHSPQHRICNRKNSEPFIFTFVRNPYTRCISAFYYLKKGGSNRIDLKDSKLFIGNSNIEFFIKTKLKHVSEHQQHFRPQHYWIPDGADFIGKYESLEKDLIKLKHIIKMKDHKIPHKNKSSYDRSFQLSKDLKDIIYKLYQKDFDLFGYDR